MFFYLKHAQHEFNFFDLWDISSALSTEHIPRSPFNTICGISSIFIFVCAKDEGCLWVHTPPLLPVVRSNSYLFISNSKQERMDPLL